MRESDVRDALGLVADVSASDGPAPFTVEAVERLKALLGGDRGGYVEYRIGEHRNRVALESPWIDLKFLEGGAWPLLSSWPLRDPFSLQAVQVHTLSEFLTRRARHENAFHQVFSVPLGVEDELKIWLPAPTGEVRHFFVCRPRASRDFGARERALARLVGLSLSLHRDCWERRRPPATLTSREEELLRLVARGLTNSQIADVLVISTGTVRKHLDNIYRKLEVNTRTAAASRL